MSYITSLQPSFTLFELFYLFARLGREEKEKKKKLFFPCRNEGFTRATKQVGKVFWSLVRISISATWAWGKSPQTCSNTPAGPEKCVEAQSLPVRQGSTYAAESAQPPSGLGGIPAGSSGSTQVPVPLCTAVPPALEQHSGCRRPGQTGILRAHLCHREEHHTGSFLNNGHGSSCKIIHKALRILMMPLTIKFLHDLIHLVQKHCLSSLELQCFHHPSAEIF